MKKIVCTFWYHILWLTEQLFGSARWNWTKAREAFYVSSLHPFRTQKNVWMPVEIAHPEFLDKKLLDGLPMNRPLLFKGALKKSACLEKWTWEYLKTVLHGFPQAYTDTSKHNFNSGIKPVNEVIDDILSDDPKYSILFGDILYKKQSFFDDLETKKWIDLEALKHKLNLTWQFFAAGKGRKTNLHGELGSSLSIQIRGTKTWTIIPPVYSINLIPRVSWRMYLESNYFADFSKVKQGNQGIKGYEVTLEEGDILWCPAFFWHFVENETASVSVSYKWTSFTSFFRNPFLSAVILSSRNPSAFMRLPLVRLIARFHPPVG